MWTALLNKWVWVGLLGLTLSGLTWAYLDTRDQLAVERERVEYERSVTFALQENLDRLQARSEALERARIELQKKVAELAIQKVEIVTKIERVYRDRPVPMEPDAQQCMAILAPHLPYECRPVSVPGPVVGMLCESYSGAGGACLPQDPG